MTALSQTIPLRVDIVSDVVCPWCIISYKQLQLAHDSLPGRFDVSDDNTLGVVAGRAGLPTAKAMIVLEDGRNTQAVRAEQQVWLEQEVHAVPTFVFNHEYRVPGAQDMETFVRLLNRTGDKAVA